MALHTEKPSPGKRRRWTRGRIAAVCAAAVVLAVGGGVLAWMLRPEPLPPVNSPPVSLAKFAATDRFARLSPEQQEPYVAEMMRNRWQLIEAVRTGQLPRDEAQKAFENSFDVGTRLHMREYYALPDQKARDAYVDNLMKESERQFGSSMARMFRWGRNAMGSGGGSGGAGTGAGAGGGGAGGADGGGGGVLGQAHRSWLDPERLKQRIEKMSPLERAQMSEFMGAIRKRREAQGLPVTPT